MKVPLEPIPTDQMAAAQKAEPSSCDQQVQPVAGAVSPVVVASPMNNAYPWLLGASVCLSAVLCWMYVTKPVLAPAAVQDIPQPVSDVVNVKPIKIKPVKTLTTKPALIPSEDTLPGEEPSTTIANKPEEASVGGSNAANEPVKVSPDRVAGGVRWENTNLKVQHILRADAGTGELEKIILNVPVRYETRTMRWTTEDIAKARTILSRLMVYERDLNNLRQQGKGILKDWNSLLERTVPSTVLRADSPSLPYNHGYGAQPQDLPDSSAVIKIDEAKAAEK